MSAARLLDPVPHTDPALRQGELIADTCIARIRDGASDPDALMRCVMRLLADTGHLIAPSSLLRGFCMAIQRELSGGADRATD